MTTLDASELVPLLDLAEQEGSHDGRAILDMTLTPLPTDGAPMIDGSSFDIKILINETGAAVIATSRKIPNLRLRFMDFLIEAGRFVSNIPANPIAAIFSVLSFLRSVNNLASLPLEEEDAQLLLAIFRLSHEQSERQPILVEQLAATTPQLSDHSRAIILEHLGNLGCIMIDMNGILMSETIIIHRKNNT